MMAYYICRLLQCIHYTQKPVLNFPCNIHKQIICAAENDKRTEEPTEVPIGKTPGQKLRPQLLSSFILKQNKWTQNFPSEQAKSGQKHCKQPVKRL